MNVVNDAGDTPLHRAAYTGRLVRHTQNMLFTQLTILEDWSDTMFLLV